MAPRPHAPGTPHGGGQARARVTRDELLADPHSGARPLAGSPGGARPPVKRRRPPAPAQPVYVLPASASTPPAPAPAAVAVRTPPAPAPVQAPAAAPAPVPAADPDPAGKARSGTRSLSTEGSGALLAFLLYPLLVNALRGGPAQAKGWLAAKFINQPYEGGGKGKKQAPNPQPKPGTGHPGLKP